MYVDFFYTIPQQIILVLASLISGLISLFGSMLILFIIGKHDDGAKLKFPYHRIMFAVSIIDCITSATFAFSFLAVPKDIFWGAVGNTTSCEAAGFLIFLFGSQTFYNLGLAIYFLLIIYYGKSQRFIESYVEPFIHTISISLPVGLAIWSLMTESLNPILFDGGWCQVYPYPPGCEELHRDKCTRGLTALIILPVMQVSLGVIPFVGILTCMIMIVYKVRKTMTASSSWRMQQQRPDKRMKQTAIQSFLYISATLIPFTLIVLTQSIQNYDRPVRFILGILVKFCVPSQGIFNFFIYIRPRILSIREKDGDSSPLHMIIWRIALGGKLQHCPVEESDFAPELSRYIPDSTQNDINTSLQANFEASVPA
jgi:hypothetical protein